ncbi:MAG: mechanosensitive ion channel family protein [Dactylosporangium sp.]|nr:mechanosensitive ion channel family protein [Dactylosporangium sp.]NNJ61133.1 mechanosensitive ion channel family protein [Dactylosporangium sp.]
MPEHVTAGQLIGAGSWIAGGVAVGLVLRVLFARLVRHASGTSWEWDDLAWAMLRDLAVPTAAIVGVWWAAEIVQLRSPINGVTDRLLLAAIVLAVSFAAARFVGSAVRQVTLGRSGVAQSVTIFVNIARIVVLAIGVLVLLQSLGVSVTPMLTALGVGGLAVALALQDTLANLFAGIHILASKKVEPGDFVRLDSGEDGYIVDINWRNTTVRQISGNLVVVPNAKFADAIMTNFHRPQQDMSVLVAVGVSYDSDLELVERVTVEVAAEVLASVDGGVRDHDPVIRYNAFADFSVNFNVVLRVHEYSARYLIVHEFIKRLHLRYRVEGIEIPFPIRTIVAPKAPAAVPAPREPAIVSTTEPEPVRVLEHATANST